MSKIACRTKEGSLVGRRHDGAEAHVPMRLLHATRAVSLMSGLLVLVAAGCNSGLECPAGQSEVCVTLNDCRCGLDCTSNSDCQAGEVCAEFAYDPGAGACADKTWAGTSGIGGARTCASATNIQVTCGSGYLPCGGRLCCPSNYPYTNGTDSTCYPSAAAASAANGSCVACGTGTTTCPSGTFPLYAGGPCTPPTPSSCPNGYIVCNCPDTHGLWCHEECLFSLDCNGNPNPSYPCR